MSPLLQNDIGNGVGLALHMDDVIDAIDDTDTDEQTHSDLTEKSKTYGK